MKYRLLFALSVMAFAAYSMEENKSDTGDSRLHELARAKDYDGCFKLLIDTSWIKKPLPEKAIFSTDDAKDAAKEMQGMRGVEYLWINRSESGKKIYLFMATMQKYSNHQVARATAMKTALNTQANTPQDCANKAGGSEKLLQLLDPRNNNEIGFNDILYLNTTFEKQGVVMKDK